MKFRSREIDVSALALATVDRGLAMLHSFWFEQARRTFAQAGAPAAGCTMAYWGVAMTLLGNPFTRQESRLARRFLAAR